MRISHIAMYVRDLEVVKEFYIRFFGAKAGELYHNPKTGLKSYFLSFDEGTRLELMNLPEMQDQKKVLVRMGYIHIAISVGSREKVDAITEKLYEAGYDVLSGPRITGDGYYESTVLGPEDNTSHAPSGSVTDVAALFGLKITKMPSDVSPFTPPLIRNASTFSSRPSTEVMFALTSAALVRRSAAWALRKAISPL